MRHSKNFDKIDSLLKPVLNNFIFHNLIVGWKRGLLKRVLVFSIRSTDLGDELTPGRSSVYQRQS